VITMKISAPFVLFLTLTAGCAEETPTVVTYNGGVQHTGVYRT
jgi:hypothetical protein